MDIRHDIPIVDGSTITRQAFENNFLDQQQPVILRGLWKQYPAYNKWTMGYFRQIMGDIEVNLFSSKLAND